MLVTARPSSICAKRLQDSNPLIGAYSGHNGQRMAMGKVSIHKIIKADFIYPPVHWFPLSSLLHSAGFHLPVDAYKYSASLLPELLHSIHSVNAWTQDSRANNNNSHDIQVHRLPLQCVPSSSLSRPSAPAPPYPCSARYRLRQHQHNTPRPILLLRRRSGLQDRHRSRRILA